MKITLESKFNVGDRVVVKCNKKVGTITQIIYESDTSFQNFVVFDIKDPYDPHGWFIDKQLTLSV